ncbi:MAG: glycerate kinase [Bacillota bacterium]|nr:glycerate kinase [Bacillota bacterium]NLL59762.1 glycerate kinase [Tissierellia bacterium]
MKKAVIIPDSFKGTLTSREICAIISDKIKMHFPHCRIVSIPVADGGEGSVDCFLAALGGQKVFERVSSPYFEDMEAFYGLIGDTAVIEMAACAGLPLVEGRKNPSLTTSYGVGQLIMAAAKRGCKKIIVGLGGSSTNDGGCGAAAAAGVKFYDRQGKEFIPVGKTLIDIDRIDLTHRARELNKIEIITMCDIDNPMYGPEGAAFVFGPQKGADEKMVIDLDRGLEHLCRLIERETRRNLKDVPGTGAAGAMGAGMIAFFDSVLQMGIETVLDTVKFDEIIAGADMIFTGEGRFDTQSLRGKVVVGVGKRAKSKNIPVTVITGGADTNIEKAYDMGISSIFTINRLPEDFEISRHKSKENLQATVDNILRLIKSLE